MMAGCSPYAFKDLGDGRGVRGAMGYPIREATAALALAQASRPVYPVYNPVSCYPQYNPGYSPVFNPVPITTEQHVPLTIPMNPYGR